MRHLARTVKLDKNKSKNKVNFNIENINKTRKNNSDGKLYETIDFSKIGKSNLCTRITIITILSIIAAIEIIGTVLFIYFYDNEK